jgi:hypothetical protein
MPTSTESKITAFANDISVLGTECDPGIASQKLQTNAASIQNGLKKKNKS